MRPAGGPSAGSASSNAAPGAAVDLNTLILMKMAQQLSAKKDESIDGGEEVEGLKVARALSRLRMLNERAKSHPMKGFCEYREYWEDLLSAHGKAWAWGDVAKAINFDRFKSMLRMLILFGKVEALLWKAQSTDRHVQQAHVQCVQAMKAIHQFNSDADWKTAWPLTFVADPVVKRRAGASEVEMEAVLAYVKTQEDFDRRSKQLANGKMSEFLSDDDDQRKSARAPKAKAKETKGGKGTEQGGK